MMKYSCYVQQSYSVSALGESAKEIVDSLRTARNCFSLINPADYPERFPVKIIAQIPSVRNLQPKDVFKNFKEIKQLVIAKLINNLKLTKDIDLILFSGYNGVNPFKYQQLLNGESNSQLDTEKMVNSNDFLQGLNKNFPELKIKKSLHVVNTCSSGTAGITIARSLLTTNKIKNCLVINYEFANHILLNFVYFLKLGVLNVSANNFENLFLSYSSQRSGFVKGDAMALVYLVNSLELEPESPLAEVIGAFATSDCHSMTDGVENGSLIIKTINGALSQSGISAAEIDYVSSHGSGTVLNDQLERKALETVFAGSEVLLGALKSQTGHPLSCASLLEIDILMKLFKNKLVPANLFYQNEKDTHSKLIVPTAPLNKKINFALKTSLGFGGYNAAAIFKNLIP